MKRVRYPQIGTDIWSRATMAATIATMDEVLSAVLAAGQGTARTRDLARAGYDRHDIDKLVRAGALRRVRHGGFVDPARFEAADQASRHQLEIRAVMATLPGYAVSHLAAIVWWGLPVLQSDLGPVHVSASPRGMRVVPGTSTCTRRWLLAM